MIEYVSLIPYLTSGLNTPNPLICGRQIHGRIFKIEQIVPCDILTGRAGVVETVAVHVCRC